MNAPAGTTINFTKLSGPGNLSATSCLTVLATGSCTVTLTSSTAGQTVVKAATDVTVGGLVLHRETGDGLAGDSQNANKTFVDANIQISPPNATNEVGSPHVLTGHVNVNDGTGFVNAPAGTTINFSKVSGPGNLSAASCLTVLATGSCSVTLTSSTAGQTVVKAATDVTVGGLLLHRETGDGLAGDSANANKTFVDANIQISPPNATNEVGSPHTLIGHVNVNDGTGFVNAPAGTTINFTKLSGPGNLSAASCLTVLATGSCTVTLTSSTAGQTVVKAATDVTVGGLLLHRETGDGLAGDSQNANKTFVDANIQISPPNATNEVGSPHVLTAHVNVNDGTGFVNAPAGTTIGFAKLSGPGNLSAASCLTVLATGSCSVTLTSSTAGTTVVRAATDVTVGGLSLHRETGDGLAGDSQNANKTFVDANIQISPPNATNEVGSPHVLTAHVNVNDGTGFVNAPAGTTINFSKLSGPGSLSAASCLTVAATGSCSVTLTSSTAGQTVVKAATDVTVGGLVLHRETGDGLAGDSANANKTFVDANIQISPPNATNEVGSPHTLTAHVNVNDGTGFVNAPAGTTINFTKVSGPGNLSAASCLTVAATGSCSVTLTSLTAGNTVVNAATDVTVGGLVLHRATGDGLAGDSQNANKTFVDANIQISPPNATNEVGSPHVLSGHVNVNTGSGFVNAPAGTTINFTKVSGPGNLSAASCLTIAATGSCTVTLTSSTAGQTVVKAATDVTVGGLVLHRETGDGLAGDSENANKTFVDANIQISPPNATNEVGSPHVLSGHVNVNTGSGFANAPAGTTINFTKVSGPGNLSAASCLTVLATGSCSVTLTSSTAGQTVVKAATDVTVGGAGLASRDG